MANVQTIIEPPLIAGELRAEIGFAVIRMTDGKIGGELLAFRTTEADARGVAVEALKQCPMRRVVVMKPCGVLEAVTKTELQREFDKAWDNTVFEKPR